MPPFAFLSPVHFDELDPMHMLHNARYAVHVERATGAWYHSLGRKWERDVALNPDQYHVVREFRIEFVSPFLGTGDLRIALWAARIGGTSCTYGFSCTSAGGATEFARGHRAIVKLDPRTNRPAPWTEEFRQALGTIARGDGT